MQKTLVALFFLMFVVRPAAPSAILKTFSWQPAVSTVAVSPGVAPTVPAPRCAPLAGSFYTQSNPTWDSLAIDRCRTVLSDWKFYGLDGVTFVIEPWGFQLSSADVVSEIPEMTLPRASVVACFREALKQNFELTLKFQLPDTQKDSFGKFRWRHHYLVDLPGEYYDTLIDPYLSALRRAEDLELSARRTSATASTNAQKNLPRINIIPLHELHVMLCSHPAAVDQMLTRLREDLRANNRSHWRVGFSLDWQFFSDTNPGKPGSVFDNCSAVANSVGPLLQKLDFIGVGAYKPSGGSNGVIDSVAEARTALADFQSDLEQFRRIYQLPHLPIGIAEWNGGGDQPNSWDAPATRPYQLAFRGFTDEWLEKKLGFDFFTFWNVRAHGPETDFAVSILSPEIADYHRRCQSQISLGNSGL